MKTRIVSLLAVVRVAGRSIYIDAVVPTQHALHETLEVAHGFKDWFETGIYVFSTRSRMVAGILWEVICVRG